MVVEERLPELFPEVTELPTPPGRGEHAYYKRLKDGWIVTAPAWPSFEQDMRFKGYQRLNQYGVFLCDMGEKNKDIRGQKFDVIREPWRLIFQQEGAKEFSLAQIIAFRWHIRPPYAGVKFPQLEGKSITTYYCPECEHGVFAHEIEPEAADQLRIHLMSGINDRHKYTPKELAELGEEWGVNLMPRRIGRRPIVRDEIQDRIEGKPVKEKTILADPV